MLAIVPFASATPPHYKSFKREQRIDYTPREEELLRIWLVYVNQGDGIVIQLPENFIAETTESTPTESQEERVEILIDGGPHSTVHAPIRAFLSKLYPSGTTLEHAVLTHNDADHLLGMTAVLKHNDFAINTLYHSGLAFYASGTPLFPQSKAELHGRAVFKGTGDHVETGLALVDTNGLLDGDYLIGDLSKLSQAHHDNLLTGNYQRLAQAVTTDVHPRPMKAFVRTHIAGEFVESGSVLSTDSSSRALRFDVLWPEARPRSYEDEWDKTTNGNSVAFRLEYGDFSMLFTGDLHADAQEALLSTLSEEKARAELACDVLKLPHHGSDDTLLALLKVAAPVVSVATMGAKGFRSKKVSKNAYQHPSSEIISALGGAHRVYHTYIHEKRFDWERVDTKEKFEALREKMVEETHILIETDGRWFRIVETADPRVRPTVTQTRRGNGTRWIEAR